MDLDAVCAELRKASERLALSSSERKNAALLGVMRALDASRAEIISANAVDVPRARAAGMKEALVDRLLIDDKVLDGILEALRSLAAQTDPIGEIVAGWKVPNGLEIRQVRVPLGVAAVIYESRPNVTVDAFALAYKSGNAVLLRGSSSALESNRAIVKAIRRGLAESGGETDAVALAEPSSSGADSHADVDWILNAVGKIDVVLPRGGSSLIKRVVETARVPVIETGSGVCHLYLDSSGDISMAVSIACNAKVQKPGACNAIECVLVHADRAAAFLPAMRDALAAFEPKTGRAGGVELRCDARSLAILRGETNGAAANPASANPGAANPARASIIPATEADWGMEFLDYILAVRVVDSLDEAIEFVNRHNTRHSEAIVTETREHARAFQARVDAACVYVNASTRFTDGGEFGMGAELGISTQKLHARGPMGLTALTTTKYLIDGEGQVRP